ncbi:hypothetical protein LSM04_007491 [Trypanosoma melophagium]|uniref:uncharacterized protein n=1 Tax=Trypanosoma melophagium TaxID=715481 RepID=UPI00351A6367|nr:hypothetical protein LSM04_007491 [Trypanosoma melophagium]
MHPIGAAPPVQREPFLSNTHYIRAEEQLAFHEKYHDRMARLIGTSSWNINNNISPDYDDISRKYPNGEGMNYHNPTPDYWADYARKLEQMGVSRTENTPPRTVNEAAPTPPPQGTYFNSPRGLHDPSRRWEAYSNKGSPARFSEEGVLQRLDLLAQDKSEPDTTDVMDLLREVEDVLVREEAQRQDRIDNSINTQSRVGLSSRPLKTSHTYDPGRPMGVPPAPAVDVNLTNHLHSRLMQNDEEEQYHHRHQHQQQQLPPPPPPSATTPTAAPSFQYGTKCTLPIRPPSVGADWSQISNYQQMEWYKSYYAWMMYYAQYYGAILASQQLQKQKQCKDHRSTKEEVNEFNQKIRGNKRNGLRELNKEYRELAAEVERLNEEPKPQKNTKTKISTRSTHQGEKSGRTQRRSSSPYNAEDDTLYRSAHSHSSLRGVPLTTSHSGVPIRSKALVHREFLKEEDESKYGVPKRNEYEKNSGATGYRDEIPWLPPERDYTENEHQCNKRSAGDRDVSWLYKYEESDTEAMSNTDSGEVGELNLLDKDNDYVRRNKIGSNYFDHQKGERGLLRRTRRNDVLDQRQDQGKRLSVYERKRQEIEKSKPRWCF